MAVNVALLVRQPDTVTLSIGETVPCRPITAAGAEILERLERTPPEIPTIGDLRGVMADTLPTLDADAVQRLGVAEMVFVLQHAAGVDLAPLLAALAAETAVGNAGARPAARRRRAGR